MKESCSHLKVLIVCNKLHNTEPNVITDKISCFVNQLKDYIHIPAQWLEGENDIMGNNYKKAFQNVTALNFHSKTQHIK